MSREYLFQRLYAEATAIPYDALRIGETKAVLYRIMNLFNIDPKIISKMVRDNKAATNAAAARMLSDGDLRASVALMGSLCTLLGHQAAHAHAPLEEIDPAQIASDLLNFMTLIAVVETYAKLKQ